MLEAKPEERGQHMDGKSTRLEIIDHEQVKPNANTLLTTFEHVCGTLGARVKTK
jgi:hypothetical protein